MRLPPLGNAPGNTPMPGNWGKALIDSGCYQLVTNAANYTAQAGDIAITVGNGTSHISIFDGTFWDADIATPGPMPSHGPSYAGAQVTYYQFTGRRN